MSHTKLIGSSQVHECNERGLVFFDFGDDKFAMGREHAALFAASLAEALGSQPATTQPEVDQ